MINKPFLAPTPPTFLTDGESLGDQNTPIHSVSTCKTTKSGKDCVVYCLQSHYIKISAESEFH